MINEIPKVMDKIDCNIHILVIDVLDTLLPSLSSCKRIKSNGKDSNNNLKKRISLKIQTII
jgi:hypothetical protein